MSLGSMNSARAAEINRKSSDALNKLRHFPRLGPRELEEVVQLLTVRDARAYLAEAKFPGRSKLSSHELKRAVILHYVHDRFSS